MTPTHEIARVKVFQAYYETTMLPTTSPSTIAWIGSVQVCVLPAMSAIALLNVDKQYALVFIPGLVFGRLFDKGHFKVPLLCASALLVTGTFLIAECTEFWQFMLCQGIAVGVEYLPRTSYVPSR